MRYFTESLSRIFDGIFAIIVDGYNMLILFRTHNACLTEERIQKVGSVVRLKRHQTCSLTLSLAPSHSSLRRTSSERAWVGGLLFKKEHQ